MDGFLRSQVLVDDKYIYGKLLYISRASESYHAGEFTCIGTDERNASFRIYSSVLVGSMLQVEAKHTL